MKTKALGNPANGSDMNIIDILTESGLVVSKGDGKRLVCQRAVMVNDVVVDRHFVGDFTIGIMNVKVGKRREANVIIAGGM